MRWPRGIGRVEVLELRPDDRVVVEAHERFSIAQGEELRRDIAAALGIEDRRVLVVYNATLKVLREGEPPPPPVILAPGRP